MGVGVGVGIGVAVGGALAGAGPAFGLLELEPAPGSGALADGPGLQEERSTVAPMAARLMRTLATEAQTMWALYVLGPDYPGR